MPTTGRGSGKRKRNNITVEEVEDEDSPQNLSAGSSAATGSTIIEDNQKSNVVSCIFFHFYALNS
jgi:hypothetical protein